MELAHLIKALSDAGSYPYPVETVEIHHTHVSVVFLAGPYAYKVKKPVDLGFLDFSSLEKRRFFCEEEVRLNRRLAPTVYLGVVPVTLSVAGAKMEGRGEVIEWAVKMERLPEEATLQQRIIRDEVGPASITALAHKIAGFHAHAERGPHISAFGAFDVVARNARKNFEQAAQQVGVTLSPAVFSRLRELTEATLTRCRPLIEARAGSGVARDTHGDLRLDHVYLFPDREPPADLVIIDCIEFNERFRYADPVADLAFLVMDLAFHGRRDLAEGLTESYFQAAGTGEGRELLPFYQAYRAVVRGKVEGFELAEKEVPESEKSSALARARAHWLLALGELEEPTRRPCLILIGGLPGTGKSTLARGLAERANFCLIRSDVVRKELASLSGQGPALPPSQETLYDPAWDDRTYDECLARAQRLLFEGKRVIVDATFRAEKRRRPFLEAIARWGVRGALLVCQAEPTTVQQRLRDRRGDASDADWSVYLHLAASWEDAGPLTRRALHVIPTKDDHGQGLPRAVEVLRTLWVV